MGARKSRDKERRRKGEQESVGTEKGESKGSKKE